MKQSFASCRALLVLLLLGCASERTATPHKATGTFRSIHAETGHVTFGLSFTAPPQITLNVAEGLGGREDRNRNAHANTIIVETTTTGFRWKNAGKTEESNGNLRWEATGSIAP